MVGSSNQTAAAPAGSRVGAGTATRSVRPSRMANVTSVQPASSVSCVTSISVVPRVRFMSTSSSMTCRPFVLSRFPVGSSASRIGGSLASARAMATPLLLAPGQLRRVVVPAVGQSHVGEQLPRPRRRVRDAGDLQRHHHVLERAERRYEVEELEHEADPAPPQARELVFVEGRDVGAPDQYPAGRRRVEAGDQSEQGRLAAAGRADDGQRLPGRHGQVERVENRQRPVAAPHRLGDTAQLDYRTQGTISRPAAISRRSGSSDGHRCSATRAAPASLG